MQFGSSSNCETVQHALCVIVMCQIYSSSAHCAIKCCITLLYTVLAEASFRFWFIAERRAQSQRGMVRRWHANTIQQGDTARNCTMRSRNFRATAGGSSIGPWAECWVPCPREQPARGIELLLHNCEASSLPKELTGHLDIQCAT